VVLGRCAEYRDEAGIALDQMAVGGGFDVAGAVGFETASR